MWHSESYWVEVTWACSQNLKAQNLKEVNINWSEIRYQTKLVQASCDDFDGELYLCHRVASMRKLRGIIESASRGLCRWQLVSELSQCLDGRLKGQVAWIFLVTLAWFMLLSTIQACDFPVSSHVYMAEQLEHVICICDAWAYNLVVAVYPYMYKRHIWAVVCATIAFVFTQTLLFAIAENDGTQPCCKGGRVSRVIFSMVVYGRLAQTIIIIKRSRGQAFDGLASTNHILAVWWQRRPATSLVHLLWSQIKASLCVRFRAARCWWRWTVNSNSWCWVLNGNVWLVSSYGWKNACLILYMLWEKVLVVIKLCLSTLKVCFVSHVVWLYLPCGVLLDNAWNLVTQVVAVCTVLHGTECGPKELQGKNLPIKPVRTNCLKWLEPGWK